MSFGRSILINVFHLFVLDMKSKFFLEVITFILLHCKLCVSVNHHSHHHIRNHKAKH